MNRDHAAGLISRFAQQRVLVIGDLMLDEFVWGKVSRISPEAPVPVVNVTAESYYPGGAANVARNLREFTPAVSVIGVTGTDEAGDRLAELLRGCGIDTSGVLRDASFTTALKTRIIARNQQVVRVDRERNTLLTPPQMQALMGQCEEAIAKSGGVVVADYGKGFLTQALADFICRTARKHGKVLAVDPHPHTLLAWKGATAVKPNRLEAFLAASVPWSEAAHPALHDTALMEAARRLMDRWQPRLLLITLGEHGMLLFQPDTPPYHTPTCAKDVFDVSGAGDTAIAVLTLGLCAGTTPVEAAELANHASGIVVGKLGTATTNARELEESFSA